MCGIIATFIRSGVANHTHQEQALKILRHRGPDETGFIRESNVFLGHTRLSLIDIEHGQQPFVSHCQGIYAIINGELYDYRMLRQQLIDKGYHFKTNCDGEMIIALYQEHGIEFLQRLKGEFAFVIWDSYKQIIFAARDPMGVKPLYYTIHQNNVFIASEIKAILAFEAPSRWNHNYIYSAHYGIYHPEETCFDKIYALAPGTYMIVDKNIVKHVAYWSFNFYEDSHLKSDSDYLYELRCHFKESVKKRLQADVPVGCYLSGGLDSTSVLAMANQIAERPLTAFTISFADANFDELAITQKTADFLGSQLHVVNVTDKDIADNFSAAIWHSEALFCNAHGIALYLLSNTVKQQRYKAILNGNGADEFLWGYLFFKEDIIQHKLDHGIDASSMHALRSSPVGAGIVTSMNQHQSVAKHKLYKKYPSTLIKMYLDRHAEFSKWHKNEIINQPSPLELFINYLGGKKLSDLNILNLSTLLFTKSTLQGYILSTIGDKMEMAHSVEGRLPFLDQNLVEFNLQLPGRLKINKLNEKYILRETLKDILPEHIYQRRKHPFAAPPADKHLLNLMSNVFNSDLLKHSPFYCQNKILNALQSLPSLTYRERIATDSRLLEVLSACLLTANFGMSNVGQSA